MPDTVESIAQAAGQARLAQATAVARAQDDTRPRGIVFNTDSAAIVRHTQLPVPDPAPLADTLEVGLAEAVNLPLLSYDVASRDYRHLSRSLTVKAIGVLEHQVAAGAVELDELPEHIARAGQAESDAQAATQLAHAELWAAYTSEWPPVDIRLGEQPITTTTGLISGDAPQRNGQPLSATLAWRRWQHVQDRASECQRAFTALSVRGSDLARSLGVWERRLGELRANLDWWDRRDAELGLS